MLGGWSEDEGALGDDPGSGPHASCRRWERAMVQVALLAVDAGGLVVLVVEGA